MSKIVLIGDSIRMGYQGIVQEMLPAMEIRYPEPNGGDSRNVLAHLDEWVISLKPDIIHLNCGLHDLKREFATPERTQVPLDEYQQNLSTIFRRITEETNATLIWATITPVNQDRHHAVKEFDRLEPDVVTFNAAALEVVTRFNLPVNDLYATIMQAGRDDLLCHDGVHYGEEGYRLLGGKVAGYLSQYL